MIFLRKSKCSSFCIRVALFFLLVYLVTFQILLPNVYQISPKMFYTEKDQESAKFHRFFNQIPMEGRRRFVFYSMK